MSLLVGPLCGKASSLRCFDPSGFDDVYAQHVRGLGQGHGFAVTERYSLLDDAETTRLIGEQTLAILRLLFDHDIYLPLFERKPVGGSTHKTGQLEAHPEP